MQKNAYMGKVHYLLGQTKICVCFSFPDPTFFLARPKTFYCEKREKGKRKIRPNDNGGT